MTKTTNLESLPSNTLQALVTFWGVLVKFKVPEELLLVMVVQEVQLGLLIPMLGCLLELL